MKTKNRFKHKAILTCHDNLLSSLYSLGVHTITYKEINGIQYLVNIVKNRGFEVGLRTAIPLDFLKVNGITKKYNELPNEQQEEIINKLKSKLVFNDVEILFTNILLDKFLSYNHKFDISFKEIETNYRKKSIAKRNIVINDYTYKRYIKTLISLSEKEVYLKTTNTFRKEKYGVNNRHFSQKFLTVVNDYKISTNNIGFSYSFGEFGNVLKLSRRYSNILPADSYECNFSQAVTHVVAFYLAQTLFIHIYKAIKTNQVGCYELTLNVDNLLQSIPYNGRKKEKQGLSFSEVLNDCNQQPNKNRIYRMAISYIQALLGSFEANGIIEFYEMNYVLYDDESFDKKHEFDIWASDERDYILSKSDIGQYVKYRSITIIL